MDGSGDPVETTGAHHLHHGASTAVAGIASWGNHDSIDGSARKYDGISWKRGVGTIRLYDGVESHGAKGRLDSSLQEWGHDLQSVHSILKALPQ